MTRRGLVLGAGGVLGFAWTVGALQALEQQEGFDCRGAEVLLGTSAGAVMAAMLGCGISVEALVRHQSGVPVEGDPRITYDYDNDSGGALPSLPLPGIGSAHLLLHTALHPREANPLTALISLLPRGRGTLDPIGRIVADLLPDGTAWAPHPATWVVAMDYDTGRRTPFGRPDAPAARLPDAVRASCAIPCWYAPVEIDGRRYVDGGACSATSLDLLAGLGLDEVFVLAPMVSFAFDRPATVAARVERRFRGVVTRQALREARAVTAGNTRVTVLGPGPDDLQAIGANLMDPTRRERVLVTSQRTSRQALRRRGGDLGPDAGSYGERDAS
jgi:NTE family protein